MPEIPVQNMVGREDGRVGVYMIHLKGYFWFS